ncbi:MAG: TCP-1/cpn60 chaperonin family protein [Chitinophagales bacterium]
MVGDTVSSRPNGSGQEIDERFKTLLNNTQAARVVSQAVEGTIGPRGLDTMMVDNFGDVIITNDGLTILKLMDVNHPVAHMIINTARAQQEEVGDGTTTATIMAAAMVAEGTAQVMRGVPVTRILEGINIGVKRGLEEIELRSQKASGLTDPRLYQVALIAGRGDREIAQLVTEAIVLIGEERLREPGFKLADTLIGLEGCPSQVLEGVIIKKEPLNRDMPRQVSNACIAIIDDNLRPEEIGDGALGTESGFKKYLELKEKYQSNLQKLIDLGVNVVLVDRSIDDQAEEVFTDAGIMAVHRVSRHELDRISELTGARKVKRTALNRDLEQLQRYLGSARLVEYREELTQIRVVGGPQKGVATIIIGASTSEVVEEKERMAKDSAAALQAAYADGMVPGGGCIEVWLASCLEELAHQVQGMTSYGVLCVKEALERPFSCIMNNAGYNPLEKLVQVVQAQQTAGTPGWGIDCDDGAVVSVTEVGIWDPAPVKTKALKAAGEVASAILRINTVIKKRDVSGQYANGNSDG